MKPFDDLLLFAGLMALAFTALAVHSIDGRLHRLDQRVSCLEHPHGASSVAVQLKPNFRVIQPVAKTGCTP